MLARTTLRLLPALAAVVAVCLAAAAAAAEYSYKRESRGAQDNQWIDELANAAGVLGDIFSEADSCEYSCRPGFFKVANPEHISMANGCGTKDFRMEALNGYPGITDCCNKHDICYDTCNSNKAHCDKVFKQCLDSYCHKTNPAKKCAHFSKLAYGGVAMLGCSTYQDSQREACVCR